MVHNEVEMVSHQREELTLDLLATHAGMHPAVARRFVELGLVRSIRQEGQTLLFDVADIPRLRMINRLRDTLGINLPGVEVVLNLLDKIRALQRENEALRSKL
jgi:MerR family transcriptional regulator/heat shock protein HspR